jgi:hypothetical protein
MRMEHGRLFYEAAIPIWAFDSGASGWETEPEWLKEEWTTAAEQFRASMAQLYVKQQAEIEEEPKAEEPAPIREPHGWAVRYLVDGQYVFSPSIFSHLWDAKTFRTVIERQGWEDTEVVGVVFVKEPR